MNSPHPRSHTLAFLLTVAAGAAVLVYTAPDDGWEWSVDGISVWHFPGRTAWDKDSTSLAADDVDNLLAGYEQSGAVPDGPETPPDSVLWGSVVEYASSAISSGGCADLGVGAVLPHQLHPNLRLLGSPEAFAQLHGFFERASAAGSEAVHVWHYGDSQIESDRITEALRSAWQARWGGSGPGYLPAVPLAPAPVDIRPGPGWVRHSGYAGLSKSLGHRRYGAIGTVATWSGTGRAVLEFRPRRTVAPRLRTWEVAEVLFGRAAAGTTVRCFQDTALVGVAVLKGDSLEQAVRFPLPTPGGTIRLECEGGAVEVCAVGLGSAGGIQVHNVPLRGSSGTFFRQIDAAQLSRQIHHHDAALILLQFGGNSVPHLKDAAGARRFGSWFGSQIDHLQSLFPDAALVVIGPSDMSEQRGTAFTTYPYLAAVRDAMRDEAVARGALFWDLFAVMGGENSMHAWTTTQPPLAGPDHIHFTPAGARKVGKLLMQSLDAEWHAWCLSSTPPAP